MSKTEVNCDFEVSAATLTNEMEVGHQKLRSNCDFEVSSATLTHEMDVGRQKLRSNCDFEVSAATLSHEMDERCIQNNIVDIFLLWIWSCVHSLEIVFCDCSMFCRDCPWTWNGCIENRFLFSVEVVCDCEG